MDSVENSALVANSAALHQPDSALAMLADLELMRMVERWMTDDR